MPRNQRPAAETYDAITRRTVVEPDSSFRPTEQQERESHEGARYLSEDEELLHARVSDALLEAPGLDFAAVDIEVDGTEVELHGRVADLATIEQLEQRVAAVDGVGQVINRLVVDRGE